MSKEYIAHARDDWIAIVAFKRRLSISKETSESESDKKYFAESEHDDAEIESQSSYFTVDDTVIRERLVFPIFLATKKSAIQGCKPFLNLPAVLNPSEGIKLLIDGYRSLFMMIAECYPSHHFGRDGGETFFNQLFDSLIDFELRTAFHMRGMMGQYSYCNCGLRAIETIDRLLLDSVELLDSNTQADAEPSNEFKEFKLKWKKLKIS